LYADVSKYKLLFTWWHFGFLKNVHNVMIDIIKKEKKKKTTHHSHFLQDILASNLSFSHLSLSLSFHGAIDIL